MCHVYHKLTHPGLFKLQNVCIWQPHDMQSAVKNLACKFCMWHTTGSTPSYILSSCNRLGRLALHSTVHIFWGCNLGLCCCITAQLPYAHPLHATQVAAGTPAHRLCVSACMSHAGSSERTSAISRSMPPRWETHKLGLASPLFQDACKPPIIHEALLSYLFVVKGTPPLSTLLPCIIVGTAKQREKVDKLYQRNSPLGRIAI